MKTFNILLFLLLGMGATGFAQKGTIKGIVSDSTLKEPLIGATVKVLHLGNEERGAVTNIDGEYLISGLDPGPCEVEFSYLGYRTLRIENVMLNAGQVIVLNASLETDNAITLDCVMIRAERPLIELGQTSSRTVFSSEQINNRSTRSLGTLNGAAPAVVQSDEGQSTYGGGARGNGNEIFIDGVRVRGDAGGKTKGKKRHPDQTVPNTEQYGHWVENNEKMPQNEPLSTFSIDVDNASYTLVRRFVEYQQAIPPDAVRIEELVNYFDYNYPEPTNEDPFSVTTELSDCPWNADKKLLHIGLQGKKQNYADLRPSNLVFLIDVSGSMAVPNKLPLVVESMKTLIKGLGERDRVAIVVYAGAAGLVLPSTPASNKNLLYEALDRLSAGGSTAGGAGIALAYQTAVDNFIKDGNNRVVLCTDGDFNLGTSSTGDLIRMVEEKRKTGVYLTLCGYGMGNLKDETLESLARYGNGNYFYIDDQQEAEKVFGREMLANMFTIAKDVKIQIEFNPITVQSYRLVGYENRILNAEDFNDDTKDAGELGPGHSVTALYEISLATSPNEAPVASVDPLKYQALVSTPAATPGELLTLKLRYKRPSEDESRLMTNTVTTASTPLKLASDNFRFSAAVAAFGMILRDSKFQKDVTTKEVLQLAKNALGKDEFKDRNGFVELVEAYKKR